MDYFTRSTFRSASSILFLLELSTVLTISCGNLIYPTIQAAFILLDQHMEFPYQTSESGQLAIFYHFQISIRNSSIRESSLYQISFDPFHSKSHKVPHVLIRKPLQCHATDKPSKRYSLKSLKT